LVVDRDVIVAATPSAPIAPAAAPRGPHCDPDTERYRHPRRVVAWRRICDWWIRVDRWSIHHDRVVAGDVHDLRVCLLDYDNRLALYYLRFHFLLIARFQVSCILSLHAHTLHSFHDISLLSQESIAKIRGPLDVL
jgi:hypothetical protein